jgi:hypothetical protein
LGAFLRLFGILVGFSAFGLSGCVAVGLGALALALAPAGSGPSERETQAVPGRPGLPPQALSPGACGVFLWSRDARDPVFTVFLSAAARRVWHAGAVKTANLEAGGAPFRVDATAHNLGFADGSRARVNLTFSPDGSARGLPNTRTISAASLTVTDTAGWSAITPLSGLAACQAGRG